MTLDILGEKKKPCPSKSLSLPGPRAAPAPQVEQSRAEGKAWHRDRCPGWQEPERGCFSVPAGGRERAALAGSRGMPPAY